MKKSENIKQPQNHGNDYNGVQNGLNARLHGDELVHQPQKNAHHNQDFQELN
jgi:hypothetical protein